MKFALVGAFIDMSKAFDSVRHKHQHLPTSEGGFEVLTCSVEVMFEGRSMCLKNYGRFSVVEKQGSQAE